MCVSLVLHRKREKGGGETVFHISSKNRLPIKSSIPAKVKK